MTAGTFMSQREAELNAGRARIEERLGQINDKNAAEHSRRLMKETDKLNKEDLDRRDELLNAPGVEDKMIRDRAAAEIVDQAQTQLEDILHRANRSLPITTVADQLLAERLERNTDPGAATDATTDLVTAQAVNQPTVLANNAGIPTEDRALNTTGLPVDPIAIPDERHVPKTRKRAEKIAKDKVPPAEDIVKPGWHGDANEPTEVKDVNGDAAVVAVENAPDVSLSTEDVNFENLI